MRRPVLLTLVLAVAILLGAGGAALAFALSGHPSTSHDTASGGASHSPTAPATSAVTSSSGASPSKQLKQLKQLKQHDQPATSASAPGSSTALPVLAVGSYSGMRPTEIAYSGAVQGTNTRRPTVLPSASR